MENEKVKEYNRKKLVLEIVGMILNPLLLFLLGFTVVGSTIESYSRKVSDNTYISFIVFTVGTIIAMSLLNLASSLIDEYMLEKKYELSNQSFGKFITKFLKSLAIMLVIGTILMFFFYLFLTKVERNWWIFLYGFLMIFNILLGIAAPVIIFPLFYKFSDIENIDLKEKINSLAEKAGVKIKGIYKFDMSKDTKKANAAFTGIGKTKRIIIGDNLLNNFNDEEILSVFAHEMGHFVKKHILKMIVISAVIIFWLLYIVSFLKIEDYSKFTNVFSILFFITLLQYFTMVFDNWYSRKNEYQADNYAKEIMGSGDGLISALHKLEKMNMADPEPNPIVEFIFYSHPSIKKRVENLSKKN